MKNAICLIIVAIGIFCSNQSVGQSKFGNVTMDELNMTVYPSDTTASAVILLKNGDTRFVYNDLYGFQFEFSLQMKIKILKPEGLDLCTQSILYYELDRQNKEIISGLSGITYNLEEGKIVKTKMSKENIVDEDVENTVKLKKFTLPAAKVGSIVEFKYKMTSDFYRELRDFDFQSSVPIAYTRYELQIPDYFFYNVNMQGYERIQSENIPENMAFNIRYKDYSGRTQSETVRCNATKTVFIGEDVPALKKEPYVWNLNDYKSRVTFELKSTNFPGSTIKTYTSSWADIDKSLSESSRFGGNLKKSGLFKNEITKTEQTLEKARETLNAIKYKVKWNERNTFYPSHLNDALKDGTGNSADMNFLLINALKAGGFNAFPIVMSTRDHGRLPLTHPSISALNYVIAGVTIDTMVYFTDASAKYGDWNILPANCMVDNARKLEDGKSSWVDLTNVSSSNMTVKSIQSSFGDSKLISMVSNTSRGNIAYSGRSDYYAYKDKNEYVEKQGTKLGGEISDLEFTNLDNTSEDLKQVYTLNTDFVLGDDFLYINPMIEKHISENLFKDEERKFPISFSYPYNYRQISTIVIPEGYVVDELPKSERLSLGDGSMTLVYRIVSDKQKIALNYQLIVNKSLFLQTEYPDLQGFFTKLVSKNSEQIVLKKVNQQPE